MSAPRPLRILHLVGADEDTGGVLSVVRSLQTALAGRDVEQVTLVNEGFVQTRRPGLDLRHSRHLLMEHPEPREFLRRGLATALELRRLLRRESFDLLHAHSRGPLMAAMFSTVIAGIPAVFTNHAFARTAGIYRLAARWPDLWTVMLNPSMARHYGIPPDGTKVRVISACCADAFFARPLPVRTPAMDRPLRLVGVGNIIRWKNWGLVIAALAQLPEPLRQRVRFELWGPVSAESDARRYAEELRQEVAAARLGECVHFAGPTNDVAGVVAGADWFVLPSTNEPCSVALMEALALGVPALVTASGGNVDILRDGVTGRLFQPDDAADLATILREILTGQFVPAEPAVLRESVHARSASAVGEQHRRLYSRIAGSR